MGELYKFMWYAEDWRASARVTELNLTARGLLFELLNASFMADDCGLPPDEKKLARLARVDREEFLEHWPEVKPFFYEKEHRLFNEKMVKEKRAATKKYRASVKNGKMGGRPSKVSKPSPKTHGLSQTEPSSNPEGNPDRNQPEPEPEPEGEAELETPEERSEEPEHISELVAGVFVFQGNDYIQRIEQVLPTADWTRSGSWFELMVERLGTAGDLNEVITHVEDCLNPRTRQAKDLGELKNPGGYIRKMFKEIAIREGIEIPSDPQAKRIVSARTTQPIEGQRDG